jgi:hypothetical protein
MRAFFWRGRVAGFLSGATAVFPQQGQMFLFSGNGVLHSVQTCKEGDRMGFLGKKKRSGICDSTGSVHATAEQKTLRSRSGCVLKRIVDGQARHLIKIVFVPCYQRCIQGKGRCCDNCIRK